MSPWGGLYCLWTGAWSLGRGGRAGAPPWHGDSALPPRPSRDAFLTTPVADRPAINGVTDQQLFIAKLCKSVSGESYVTLIGCGALQYVSVHC